MRFVAYFLVMVLTLILQSTVVSIFQIGGAKFDLPLVLVICVALTKGEKFGATFGLIFGLLEDMMYGRLLGFYAIIKFAVGYLLGYFSKDIFKGPIIITMGITFFVTIVYNLLFMFLCYLTGECARTWHYFLPTVLPVAILNMIISPFIYRRVNKIEHFFDYYFNTKY